MLRRLKPQDPAIRLFNLQENRKQTFGQTNEWTFKRDSCLDDGYVKE